MVLAILLSPYLTTERNLIKAIFTLYRMATQYSINSNGTELEQVVHTNWTLSSCWSGWLRELWWTKSQSSLLNIYFRLSGLQPSLLLIHFRYCSDTCSHFTLHHRTYTIWNAPFSRSAWRIFLLCNRNRTEITSFLCVNGSPIWYQQYGFRDGARASILYSVSIA